MARQGLETVTFKAPRRGLRTAAFLLLTAAIIALSRQAYRRLGLRPFSLPLSRGTEEKSENRKSAEAGLSADTLYALQLGAFTQESAARQLAQEYRARGAAGYVYNDEGSYRVLAAAYPTRAEAQAVQTRLAAQGIGSYIHPFTRESVRLRMEGMAGQIAALGEVLDYLDALTGKLYTLSTALDAREMTAEEAGTALGSEGFTCGALGDRLSAAFPEGLPDCLLDLHDTLKAIAGAAPADGNSAARTGAALKECQLKVFFGLLAFCRGLQ